MNAASLVLVLVILCSNALAQTQQGSFDRIMVVNFENQARGVVVQRTFFKHLTTLGTYLPNYYAVTHPSQPNYIAQIAGSTLIVNSDEDFNIVGNQKMVGDLLIEKGFTWKSYQENYPGNCYTGTHKWPYYRKHNPFMSFAQVYNNASYCSNIVDSSQLYKDIESNQLPNLIYYTPNIDNDGHNTGVDYADRYLHSLLCPLLSNPSFMNGTLIVVTFDEDDHLANNNIYTILLGPMAPAHIDDTRYDHYSLLRTIEDNFNLGTLGRLDSISQSFSISNNSKYIYNCTVDSCYTCGPYDMAFLNGIIAGSVIGGVFAIMAIVGVTTVTGFLCFRKKQQKRLQAKTIDLESVCVQ